MNTTTQFLVAAYVLGLGLLLAHAISLWIALGRTGQDADKNTGGRP